MKHALGEHLPRQTLMIYELVFDDEALKEWKKLQPQIKLQLKTKLKERLHNPRVPKDKLSGMAASNLFTPPLCCA